MNFAPDIDLNRIEPKPLSPVYNLADFDCGDADINNFLWHDALVHQEERIASTTLFIYADQILGFCTLACDAIKLSKEERIDTIIDRGQMKHYDHYPAILLARFGRDKRFEGKHIGSEVITAWIIGYAKNLESVGVRFITVDAYPHKEQYYAQLGFVRNNHKDYTERANQTIYMRFDLKYAQRKIRPGAAPQSPDLA